MPQKMMRHAALRLCLRDKLCEAPVMQTAISRQYRRRAADLARQSDDVGDEAIQLKLIEQALSWITFAENEEILDGNS